MGSKRSIAAEYLPKLMEYRKPGQTWVEPFCGGCNSIDKVEGPRIANDLHPHLITMWRALQQGWQPPDEISEFEYYKLRKEQRLDPLTGFAGFGCAFGGKWFESYARDDTGVNYAAQSKRTVLKQIEKMPASEVTFYHGSYDSFPIPPNSFIYCDPPYADTGAYRVEDFDHRRFWKWANRMCIAGHTVVVAEYTAPPDWVSWWTKAVKTRLSGVKSTAAMENIFVRAITYDEVAAREYYDPPMHKIYSVKQVLHFILGAARKDNSHIVIDKLRATASNHLFTLHAPINIPFDVKPNAKTLSAAIKVAEETRSPVAIGLTKAGRLSIKADKFSSYVDCLSDNDMAQPHTPQGYFVPDEAVKAIYTGFKKLQPVMCENDLRAWANGIAITKNSCMATDNKIYAEVWHGGDLRDSQICIVGYETVNQVVSLGEEPTRIQISASSITFWYYGERWLTSVLVDEEFPTARISELLDRRRNDVILDAEFYDAIKMLRKVSKEKTIVTIQPHRIVTNEDDDEEGANFSIATGATKDARADIDVLVKLDGLADSIDWSQYPQPMSFFGKGLRGIVAGVTRR